MNYNISLIVHNPCIASVPYAQTVYIFCNSTYAHCARKKPDCAPILFYSLSDVHIHLACRVRKLRIIYVFILSSAHYLRKIYTVRLARRAIFLMPIKIRRAVNYVIKACISFVCLPRKPLRYSLRIFCLGYI